MFKDINIYILPIKESFDRLFKSLKVDNFILEASIRVNNNMERNYILSGNTYKYIMNHPKMKNKNEKKKLITDCIQEFILEGKELKECEDRLILNTIGVLCDPPTTDVIKEVITYLFANPHLSVEYLGRGYAKEKSFTHFTRKLPENEESKFVIDILGGIRNYYWQTHPAKYANNVPLLKDQLKGFLQWISDPEAKVILSLGSGGTRFLGATALLKVLNLFDSRKYIQEIWGCSGGSILGYFYSIGMKPEEIERIGYDFYNKKITNVNIKVKKLFHFMARRFFKGHSYETGISDMEPVFADLLNHAEKADKQNYKKIPFYGVSTNVHSNQPTVLETNNTSEPIYNSFMISAKPLDALRASCSIPYFFPAPVIKNKTYWDGATSEETPLLLPIRKWLIDKKENKVTQKKLKVIYVQLSPRITKEIKGNIFLKMFPFREMSELLDCIFESKSNLKINFVNEMSDVEVLNISLEIDKLAFLTESTIPYLIKKGKMDTISKLILAATKFEKRYEEKVESTVQPQQVPEESQMIFENVIKMKKAS